MGSGILRRCLLATTPDPELKEEVMIERRTKHHGFLLFLVVILLSVLVSACGVDDPTGKTTQTVAGVVSGSTATIGMKLCTSCHSAQTEDWLTSKHANVDPVGNLYSRGIPTMGLLLVGDCVRCHDPQGDSGQLVASYTGNTVRPVVGCESCHGGGDVHYAAGGAGYIGFATLPAAVIGTTSTVSASAQFRTCTSCHELLDRLDPASTTTATTSPHDTGGAFPINAGQSITDTHFATPGDWSGTDALDITGYAMDYSSEKVCTNCHNPHKAPDQNREWAQSAHGDMNGVKTDYWSGAWAHYDWSQSNRAACQRCHTTSGFAAYADALRTGDLARATGISDGAIKVIATATTPSWKPEMLQCWGCHTDNKGTRRNPGQRTTDYGYVSSGKTYAIASYTYPDVADSNICMTCHTGRESGETLLGLNDSKLLAAGAISVFNFASSGFINSHYLTGGGTVFTATGFEFPGRDYENLSSYRHEQIGTAALPFSGSGGPCVGCHMSRPGGNGDHLFLPVTRSSTTIGHIDGIASEVCIYCHTVSGAGGLEDLINERKEEFEEAIEATAYVVGANLDMFFMEAYPYWYQLRTRTAYDGAYVTVNKGSAAVSGTLSIWSAGTTSVAVGSDYFKVNDDGGLYKIVGATSNSLTLESAYQGASGAGLAYTIVRGGSAGGIRNWLTLSAVRTSAGTVATGKNSYTVTGTGTAWITSGVVPGPTGDRLILDFDKNSYEIASVDSETQLTLASKPSATTSGATYNIAAADTDTSGNTSGRYNMGTAFNLNLLAHDPGAYVHNRIYTKRLLYDSIDWADDNLMNYSTGATLNALSSVAKYKVGAIKYLLPNGVLGISAERP